MGKVLLLVVVIYIAVLTSCQASSSDSDDYSASGSSYKKMKTTGYKKYSFKDDSKEMTANNYWTNCDYYNNKCNGALKRAKKQIVKFTFQYLYEAILSNTSDAKICSPLTTFYYLCYFILYTFGTTLQELLKFTGLKNKEEAICVMKEINKYSQNQPEGIQYEFGIEVVGDYCNNFTEPFKQGMVELVEGRGRNTDFNDPEASRRMVNKDIAELTNNMVKKAITESNIFEKDKYGKNLVFASGEFFQAMWQKEFNMNNITMDDYCDNQNNVIKVPYLNQCGVYNYAECPEMGLKIISFPFVNGYYDCVLFLPNKPCGLNDLVQKLQNIELFNKLICSLEQKKVNIRLPVYNNATSEFDNVAILKQTMEIDSFFEPKMAQIKNAYGMKTGEYVSNGRQKLIIKNVLSGAEPYSDEECSSNPDMEEYEFVANHPVVFVIMSHGVPQIVAVGKVIT